MKPERQCLIRRDKEQMPKEMMVVYTDSRTREQLDPDKVHAVRLALDDRAYELYLSEASKAELDEALQPFLENEASTRVPPHTLKRALDSRFAEREKPRKAAGKPDREDTRTIRQWWRENWEAANLRAPHVRGSLPEDVVTAYHRYDGAKVQPSRNQRGRSPKAGKEV